MSKIQNLKAIHNLEEAEVFATTVVSDVKDTKFESNSQPNRRAKGSREVVSDVKDTKFESNSQPARRQLWRRGVVSDVKDTKFESNSQPSSRESGRLMSCF